MSIHNESGNQSEQVKVMLGSLIIKEIDDEPVTPVEPAVVEQPAVPVMEEVVETACEEPEEVVEEPVKEVTGVVYNCTSLNVREKASVKTGVVAKLKAGSEVMIDTTVDHPVFYKVTLPSGVEGYCMKNYIEIKA